MLKAAWLRHFPCCAYIDGAVAPAGAAGGRACDEAGRAGIAPAPAAAAAARGVRGVISAAGSADRDGRAIVAGAGARAAVRGIRIARSAHRAGVPAAGVAAGIGDEAGEYDTAIDTVITHNVRPPEISLGDCLRSIL